MNRPRLFSAIILIALSTGLISLVPWRTASRPFVENSIFLAEERVIQKHSGQNNSLGSPVSQINNLESQDSDGTKTPGNLESSFHQLAVDADSGDLLSSCLLSRALALCQEAEKLRQEGSHWIEVATLAETASSDETFAIKKIIEVESITGNASTLCKGLSPEHQRQMGHRMFQAAELGDPQAMAHYALYSEPPEKGSATRKQFDDLYRKHAVAMLERSASMGNMRAMRALYEVYLHGVSPNRDSNTHVEKDPAAAIAIGTALLDMVSARERQYIAETLNRIENKADIFSSDRYASLQKRYFKYRDEITLKGFDESGKNMGVQFCRNQLMR